MKKKLLVVTPRYPYPVVGGDRIRIFYICKALAQHFDLTLLSLCETREELDAPLPTDGVFARIERMHLPRWRSWLNCLLALPTEKPLQVAYYALPRFAQRIGELAAQHDGVFMHLIRTGDMARNLTVPRFLEMTDAISLNYSRIRRAPGTQGITSLIYRMEQPRLHAYEKGIARYFDHTFLVSATDQQFLFGGDPARGKVSVVSNGVDCERSPYAFAQDGKDLVFIGNMGTLPNMDAVQYAAREILPRVREAHPTARLRVIGRIGPRERALLGRLQHVQVIGEVDSVAQAARGAGAGLCPMRLGAGVQNKLLEYMALGLPAVSTTIGFEGLSAQAGVALEVADDPRAFAAHVIALLSDRARARAMAQAARQYVQAHHSWKAVLAPMVQAIEERLRQQERPLSLPG